MLICECYLGNEEKQNLNENVCRKKRRGIFLHLNSFSLKQANERKLFLN